MTTTPGVTLLLDDPYFTGDSAIAADVPSKYPIAIGGRPFAIELSLFERQTIERFRDPYDQSDEPGEQSLNTKGPWLRSASKWDHGAGQTFWDIKGADRERFRASKGVDIWSEERRVALLNDTREIRDSSNTNLKVLAVGAYLYVADGNDVVHTTDPAVASPTWVDAVIEAGDAAGSVSDMTTDGTVVYAALGANGVHKTALGASSSSALSAYTANLVQYANGRLLAADDHELVEISAAGASTVLMTHANTAFDWVTICGAPNGVYAAGNAGDRAEIYFVGLDASFALDTPIYAATLPDGELINAMYFYNGAMVLGTSAGLRLAVVTSADGLSYGPAIEVPGGVAALEPQGEFVWFSWKNYDGTSTGLGRCSLASFTDTLVPAYASDLMATAQGVVTGVVTFSDKRYFAVNGAGIYAEFTNKVASGTLYQGWVNYSTTEPKALLSFDMRHEPLAGEVAAAVLEEDGTTTSIGASTEQGSLSTVDPLGMSGTCETCEIQLTLERSSTVATTGPILRRWTLRALITPARADEFLVPIILREQVVIADAAEGHTVGFRPLEDFLFLKALEAQGTPTLLQLGSQSHVVYIEQVLIPREESRRWTTARDFPQGLVFVKAVALE